MIQRRESTSPCWGLEITSRLRLKPDYAMPWHNLALAHARTGNRSAALEAAKLLRKNNPQKADELINLIMKP